MRRRDLLEWIAAMLGAAGGALEPLADALDGVSEQQTGDPDDADPRTAVVDRVEGETAVVLYEANGRRESVPLALLPPGGREAGVVLRVPHGESIAIATVDRRATAARRAAAGDRFDELSEAPNATSAGNATGG